MARRSALASLLWVTAAVVSCAGDPPQRAAGRPAPGAVEVGRVGGRLVTASRSEPRTFHPLLALTIPSRTVVERLHADLVRINRYTQKTESALAESCAASADGRRFTVKLRPGLRFSDGEPADADDVVFTYLVILDEETGAPHRDLLTVDGQPMSVRKVDDLTVEFELASPYAVGERLFDSIPILPEHRLREAWEEGRIREVWGLDTPPGEIVGLGPFRLRQYLPGERVILERNPHYWKTDEAGQRLPYLDELVILFVADESAQAIRLQSGELDVTDRLGPADYSVLARSAARSGLRLEDLGPGLQYNLLFFNLNDLEGRDLEAVRAKQAWFRELGFRRAVSEAIDRQALARLVFDGRATASATHVTGGNKLWRNESLTPPVRSLEGARSRLERLGYRWDDAGDLLDPAGTPVAFSLLTNSSNAARVQMATLIQEDLRQLGIEISVAALEFRTVVQRVLGDFDYEACILGLGGGDVDPNSDLPVWLSDGGNHLWDLAENRWRPDWQVELDELLRGQLSELDPARRKAMYERAQEIIARQVPAIVLVAQNVLVAAKSDLGNFRPAVMRHSTLWNVDELFWRPQETEAEP